MMPLKVCPAYVRHHNPLYTGGTMECNQGQGFTACVMKLEVPADHAAQFLNPSRHLFNVMLTKKDEGTGREHTQAVNLYPQVFSDAARFVKGMLAGAGLDVWGFRGVVDCWIEPVAICDYEFQTAEDRQRWLVEHVCQQIRQRQDRETQALKMENEAMKEEIAFYYSGRIGGML